MQLDLNVPIINLSEGKVEPKKVTKDATSVDSDLPLIVYDPLFQDIPIDEDAGEMSLVGEAQLGDKALVKKEDEFSKVLNKVTVEPMNAAFKEVILENVAMKEQIANLNTQV